MIHVAATWSRKKSNERWQRVALTPEKRQPSRGWVSTKGKGEGMRTPRIHFTETSTLKMLESDYPKGKFPVGNSAFRIGYLLWETDPVCRSLVPSISIFLWKYFIDKSYPKFQVLGINIFIKIKADRGESLNFNLIFHFLNYTLSLPKLPFQYMKFFLI